MKQLSEKGLITGRKEPRERGPDATVYSLTVKGRKELRGWLEEAPGPEHVRSEFMLKFFFGSHVSAETNARRLAEYEQLQKRLLKHYKHIEQIIASVPEESEDAFFWRMSLRRGQLLTRARLRWCRECQAAFASFKQPKGGSK